MKEMRLEALQCRETRVQQCSRKSWAQSSFDCQPHLDLIMADALVREQISTLPSENSFMSLQLLLECGSCCVATTHCEYHCNYIGSPKEGYPFVSQFVACQKTLASDSRRVLRDFQAL